MENKNKQNLKVVNLGSYINPKIQESFTAKRKWVMLGIDGQDDFFRTLIERYESSPTNQACVDGCTDLIYGNGVQAKDNSEIEDYLYSLTSKEEIRKIVYDYKLFGNAAIQATFNEDRSRIVGFFHVPIDALRPEKVDDGGKIPAYWYSTDWQNPRLKPTRIPAYGTYEWEDDVQIMWLKRYSPGKFYLGIPDYYSSTQYCQIESEISNLHLNNIQNNFMPSTILNFNSGLPGMEEQYLLEASIKEKFTGSSNAGKFILSFNENPETKTTIDVIPNENLHEHYDFLAEETSRKIMLAHRITSQLLFGIRTASGFSSNADELKIAYEIFFSMVIKPFQQELLMPIREILEYNGVEGDALYFNPLIPFNVMGDLTEQVGQKAAEEIITNPEDQPDEQPKPGENTPAGLPDGNYQEGDQANGPYNGMYSFNKNSK